MPLPPPTTKPQSTMSCHGAVMIVVKAKPLAMMTSASSTLARTPMRSISAAPNGPVTPYINRLIETASEMVARLQPKSFSIGTISTPGAARNPAATSSTKKVRPATTQP